MLPGVVHRLYGWARLSEELKNAKMRMQLDIFTAELERLVLAEKKP
jgi:hypothetical protein